MPGSFSIYMLAAVSFLISVCTISELPLLVKGSVDLNVIVPGRLVWQCLSGSVVIAGGRR